MTRSPRVRRNGAPKVKGSNGKPSPLVYAQGLVALLRSRGHVKNAIVNIKEAATEKLPSHLRAFLTRLWHRYEVGSIDLCGRATPVRAKKVSDAQAKKAAAYFAEGRHGLSGWRPFQSAGQVGTFPNSQEMLDFLKFQFSVILRDPSYLYFLCYYRLLGSMQACRRLREQLASVLSTFGAVPKKSSPALGP